MQCLVGRGRRAALRMVRVGLQVDNLSTLNLQDRLPGQCHDTHTTTDLLSQIIHCGILVTMMSTTRVLHRHNGHTRRQYTSETTAAGPSLLNIYGTRDYTCAIAHARQNLYPVHRRSRSVFGVCRARRGRAALSPW